MAWGMACDMGTSGAVDIPKTRVAEPTEYQPLPDVTDWKQFKQHVNSLEHRRISSAASDSR